MNTEATTLNISNASPTAANAASDNVYSFSTTLRELRENLEPAMLRQRTGWHSKDGSPRKIEYVEWHTVADILDTTAPDWSHSVKDIRTIGEIAIVTVAITIGGITREGIGTGTAKSEIGIKKAEHDALKRAAVKFGIARDLYKNEERSREAPAEEEKAEVSPVAASLSDMVTSKQLGMIRGLARQLHVNAETECSTEFNCSVTELSRRAASRLIDKLQAMQPATQMRMAG